MMQVQPIYRVLEAETILESMENDTTNTDTVIAVDSRGTSTSFKDNPVGNIIGLSLSVVIPIVIFVIIAKLCFKGKFHSDWGNS